LRVDLHGLFQAFSFLGLLEVVEDGALGDAQHVPDAVEVGLVLILHPLQPLIDADHSLLDGLHLQLHEGGDALIEGCVVDLLLDSLPFLAHQFVHFGKGHFLAHLLHALPSVPLHHAALDLFEYLVVVLD
jgi:hypothetical protein